MIQGENKEIEAFLSAQGVHCIQIETEENLWKTLAETVAPTRVYLSESIREIPREVQENPYLRFVKDTDTKGGA